MDESLDNPLLRIPVGTHYRVWWFWVPVILGGLGLLSFLVLLPVSRMLASLAGAASIACFAWATISGVVIVRGRRWLQYDGHRIRVIDLTGTIDFVPEDVTDLTIIHTQHHAAGQLVAKSRDLHVEIETPLGRQTVHLTNRMHPGGVDPLDELIERLCDRLTEQAKERLTRQEQVTGEDWYLDKEQLTVSAVRRETVVPLASISAVETIGQEFRIWTAGNPRAVVRLPLDTRNAWLLPRLLGPHSKEHDPTNVSDDQTPLQTPLGRILFERTSGPFAMIVFLVIGMVFATISAVTLSASIAAAEPVGIVLGVLLAIVSLICLIGAVRVRRTRFCCHEHGLERVTITATQQLPFASIDVFSYESRRNRSQGRYTGTTYTLVFADRSREQGRGIFFSTTVRNTDEELEHLRERVSQVIAHRMARTFARSRRVQWTPELWFCDDVLEFTRPRRLLTSPKLAVVPYDAITDFEIRDGLFHIWTTYQERAVITVKTSSANFYPGLIVLESLMNAHVSKTVDEWIPSTHQTS